MEEARMSDLITRPMLAVDCGGVDEVSFPVLATPKLDGWRCLTLPTEHPDFKCNAFSRTFKPIANVATRNWIQYYLPQNLDGELVAIGPDGEILPFYSAQSAFSGHKGQPEFLFLVFDYVKDKLEKPYHERMEDLRKLRLPRVRCRKLLPVLLESVSELEEYEAKCLAEGYEGVMLRDPDGPYKLGRSTKKQGWLLKLKQFVDSEAEVIRAVEGFTNGNTLTEDELGMAKRSGAQDGMIPTGVVGALEVRDLKTGVDFSMTYNHITLGERLPKDRFEEYTGKLVKYRYQPVGTKEKPRFPQPLGWRSKQDM
jgi:DNA ligase 1